MLDDRSYMRDPRPQYWSLTTILLVSLVVCFVIQKALEQSMGLVLDAQSGHVQPRFDYLFALSLEGLKHGYYWELITFQFMHGGLLHIVGNMFCLYFFGRAIEQMFGPARMIRLYLLSGTIGGLCQVALALILPRQFAVSVVGASAGIFGLIAAFACTVPDQPITMLIYFILPVTFKAIWFLAIEAVISVGGLIAGFFSTDGTIAHAAHLGGMLTGIVFVKASGWLGQAGGMWQPGIRRESHRELVKATAQRGIQRSGSPSEEIPSAEFISREVDPILEKISAHGIHSLTARERQILEAARSKMAKR
jgi:membrane associated rhomboid family serine protease